MTSEFDIDFCDSLPCEDSISTVKAIPIKLNKLACDKGNLKEKDIATFRLWQNAKMLVNKNQEKSSSFKVYNSKLQDDFNSEPLKCTDFNKSWKAKLNEKDSYDILKSMKSKTKRLGRSCFNRMKEDIIILISGEVIYWNKNVLEVA